MHKLFSSILLISFLLLTACASLKSISVAPLPKDRTNEVKASSNSWNFLGLTSSNDFADEVLPALAQQCPEGEISGILTKYSTYWYFLVSNREVTARGYCVPFTEVTPPMAIPDSVEEASSSTGSL